MAESDTKVIRIVGGAGESVGEAKKTRKTAKKKHGGAESDSMNAPMGAEVRITKEMPAAPAPSAPSAPSAPVAPAPAQEGGEAKQIRVELKKKQQTRRVQLQPKKVEPKPLPKKTRKHRKVLLGVMALHRRMTRAKKVHAKVKEMPLASLKELLLRKKLMKPNSKAPESVLRQIAADAQIMEGKAL